MYGTIGLNTFAKLGRNRDPNDPDLQTHVDAIGMKAAGGSDPMQRDTLFRIASMKEKDQKRLARVTEAFLKMKKFDIAALKRAYKGV